MEEEEDEEEEDEDGDLSKYKLDVGFVSWKRIRVCSVDVNVARR